MATIVSRGTATERLGTCLAMPSMQGFVQRIKILASRQKVVSITHVVCEGIPHLTYPRRVLGST